VELNRVGAVVRAIRIKKRYRQSDVAERAGVSRALVSRVERGHLGEVTLADLMRVGEALEMTLRLVASWRGGDLDRLLNARHAALHESVARHFRKLSSWVIAPEVSFAIYSERGTVDVLAWHEHTRTLLVIELKTEIVDVNELMGRVDVKRRLAPQIGASRGWQPHNVAAWVIIADSSSNRRRVGRHRTTLRAAFPADGRTMRAWLERPSGAPSALSFWSDAHRGDTNQQLATVKRVRRPKTASARA